MNHSNDAWLQRSLTWLLGLLVGVYSQMALAQGGATATTQVEPQASPGTLWKVRQTGQLVFGYRHSAIPFSFVSNPSQSPRGYSIDLCQALIEPIKVATGLTKLDVRWVSVEDEKRLPRVVSGEVDIECGMTAVSSSRIKLVGMSSEIFKSEVRFLVRPSSGVQGLPDLAARRIVFAAGATAEDILVSAENKAGLLVEHRAQKSELDAFNALDRGEADAWFVSELTARASLAQLGRQWSEFVFVGAPLISESYAIALRHHDAELKTLVDQTLQSLKEKGVMAELQRKWFTQVIDGLGYGLGY